MTRLDVNTQKKVFGGASEGYCSQCGIKETWYNRPKSVASFFHWIDYGHWFQD